MRGWELREVKARRFASWIRPTQGRMPQSAIITWTAVLLALNLAWRTVRYGLAFPIWGDEAFVAVNLFKNNFLDFLQPLDHAQIVPLLFIWLQWGIAKLLGYHELAIRLLPFLAGLGSLFLFSRLAFNIFSGHRALASVAIFAASFYPVRHAAEIKPYSTDLFVALALLTIAWRLKNKPDRLGGWVFFTSTAALAVWASYPSVFVSGGVLLVFCTMPWRDGSRNILPKAFFSGVVVAASFAAMYGLVGKGQAEVGAWLVTLPTWSFTFPPLAKPWLLPFWFLDVHTGNMFAYPNGGNNGGSLITTLLFLGGICALWSRHRFTVLLLLSPLPLMFIAAALRAYPYGGSARVAMHVAPAICLLAGSGLVAVVGRFSNPRNSLRIMYSIYTLFSLAIAVAIAVDIVRPFKSEADLRDRQIVQTLAGATEKEDQWVIFGGTTNQPHVPNLFHWGGSAARFRFNVLRYAQIPVYWGPAPADVVKSERGRTWLIVYRDNKAEMPEDLLGRYLREMAGRFGAPTMDRYRFGDDKEMIFVYRFDNMAANARGS
jgi:4-amino-4-deoxy-L-arabinose transferase-like glycosyltransferase